MANVLEYVPRNSLLRIERLAAEDGMGFVAQGEAAASPTHTANRK